MPNVFLMISSSHDKCCITSLKGLNFYFTSLIILSISVLLIDFWSLRFLLIVSHEHLLIFLCNDFFLMSVILLLSILSEEIIYMQIIFSIEFTFMSKICLSTN